MLTVESARQADGGGARATAVSPGPADEKDNATGSDAPGRGANAARAAALAALMRYYRGDAAKAWAASLQGQAGVDALVANHGDAWFGALPEDARKAVTANMTLLGAATSPRTPPTPEDHASTSSWIQAQDWKDDRKQLAHEELHKRIGLANRLRTAALAWLSAKRMAEKDSAFQQPRVQLGPNAGPNMPLPDRPYVPHSVRRATSQIGGARLVWRTRSQ